MIFSTKAPLFADHALAARLEAAEAAVSLAAGQGGASQAVAARELGGAALVFGGVHSPLTQVVGLMGPIAPPELEAIEHFFFSRGAPVTLEVSPFADAALLPALVARGYQPLEQASVLVLRLYEPAAAEAARITARQVAAGERDAWVRAVSQGFAGADEVPEFLLDVGRQIFDATAARCYLAEIGREIVGAAAMNIQGATAVLFATSTRAQFRRRGVQQALMAARLFDAVHLGADLAMIVTSPGSSSQRNAERAGFRVAYTRSKWMKMPA